MPDRPDIAVAIVAHISREPLSDGNTKTRVEGRLSVGVTVAIDYTGSPSRR